MGRDSHNQDLYELTSDVNKYGKPSGRGRCWKLQKIDNGI